VGIGEKWKLNLDLSVEDGKSETGVQRNSQFQSWTRGRTLVPITGVSPEDDAKPREIKLSHKRFLTPPSSALFDPKVELFEGHFEALG